MRTHLEAACRWADVVILGDQGSTDATRSIAAKFGEQVKVIHNPGTEYDEGERQRIVFDAARQMFPGEPKILMAIDADEILSANYMTSGEWDEIRRLPPGSGIYAEWVNLDPGFETWFPYGGPILIGVVDDGMIGHSAGKYHVPRLVQNPNSPRYHFKKTRLLHYQYVDAERSASKNRSYQVQEWIDNPTRPIRLFRRFNATLATNASMHLPIAREWVEGFDVEEVRWRSVEIDEIYRWDREVVKSILMHGAEFFRRLDIWEPDWIGIAIDHGVAFERKALLDPRTNHEKRVHRWLRASQHRMSSWDVRLRQAILRLAGW
jgi:hypothetical protein